MLEGTELRLKIFNTREEASRGAASFVASVLSAQGGEASLMVSGGTTPVNMFAMLSELDAGWERVTIGLVDERWVAADDPGANERLVRQHLLQNKAAAARFLPMISDAPDAGAAAALAAMRYAPHCHPVSLALLGMGPDGHTASWFPGSPSLSCAFVPPGGAAVVAIDAAACPAAGAYTTRLTLTGPVILGASAALLLIFGQERLEVLEAAMDEPASVFPVRHLVDGLGDRLGIFWAP